MDATAKFNRKLEIVEISGEPFDRGYNVGTEYKDYIAGFVKFLFFGNAQRTNQPEDENSSCWLSITNSSVVAKHGIVVMQCREGRIANLSPKRK